LVAFSFRKMVFVYRGKEVVPVSLCTVFRAAHPSLRFYGIIVRPLYQL
jgi:hypothetical protein